MIERVLEHLGRPRRRPGRPVARLPPRGLPQRLPRRPLRGRRAPLRRRARAARHRRRHPLRRRRCRHRRALPGRERRRADRPRHRRPGGPPRAGRCRGDHRPAPRRGPLGLRRRAHRGRRAGHRLHREAAPRRGADRPDQRRHVRARAGGPRPHRGGRARQRRAGHLPGHRRRRGPLRLRRRHLLDRRRHPHDLPGRQPRPRSNGRRGAPERGVHPTRHRGRRRSATSWVGAGARVEAGAEVHGSVLLPGAVVAAGARVRDSIVGPAGRGRCRRLARSAGRSSATTWTLAPGTDPRGRPPARSRPREGRSSPAAPASSARRSWTACWPRAMPSTSSTTSRNGNLANLAEARADRDHELKVHQVDVRDPGVVDLIARRAARGRVPPRRAGRRPGVGGPARPSTPRSTSSARSTSSRAPAWPAPARSCSPRAAAPSTASPTPADLPVKESHPLAPVSPYGVAKRTVTDYLHTYRELLRRSSTRRWPSPTSTAPARTPTARPAWWRSSPASSWRGARARSSATAPRPGTSSTSTTSSTPSSGPPTGGAACSATSAPRSRRRSTSCTPPWRPPPASPSRPSYGPGPPRRAGPQRPRPGPGQDPPRLAALDGPAHRRGRGPGLVPGLIPGGPRKGARDCKHLLHMLLA